MFDELVKECRKLPEELAASAEAVSRYVNAFCDGAWAKNSSGRFVPEPNFVTLKPQTAQAKNLAVTIRGNPHEFESSSLLEVKADQHGYSRFNLQNSGQLADCMKHIERACVLQERGRTRPQSTPKTVG